MSRSGPLHHNRVEKNVAPSCVHCWEYAYGASYRHVFRARPPRVSQGPGDASCSGITQRARPRQPCNEADRSTDTVQIADEDEIDFGALRTRATPTVSPVESTARATRSSPHERDTRRNREPVRHVVIRCRANDGSSHKRPRFILYRACRIPRTSTRCERSGNRSSHAWLPVRFYSSPDVGDDVCGLRRPPPLKVNASIGIRSRLARAPR